MTNYRAYLLGGMCLGLMSVHAAASDEMESRSISSRLEAFERATAGPATGTIVIAADDKDDQQPGAAGEMKSAEPAAAPAPAEAPPAEAAPAPEAAATAAAPEDAAPTAGTTSFYGDTAPASDAAWAAEAQMNPDYTAAPAPAAAEAPAAAPAPAEAAATAEEPPAATTPGTTSYYGEAGPAGDAAWAAEAKMNPDYDAAAPAATTPAAAAAEESSPATPSGTTSFYGDSAPPGGAAWAAEAKMNPDYSAASPAKQAAVEACRDALNAEARAGKINFATSQWDVLPESFKTLEKIAKIAKDCNAGFVIEVGGHTDNVGKPPSNKTISELRAKSVVAYLTKAGVPAAKLKAVGYGQDKPVGDNATPEGRKQNRRIEFLVISN